MTRKNEIEQIFREAGGILSTKELTKLGVSHYQIKKLLNEHLIESIKRGIYKLSDLDIDEKFEVSSMISKGVFCMYTAASMHELTTNIPYKYHVAIPKKNKVKIPSYPPVKLYYWDTNQYSIGIQKVQENDRSILVYDLEKTVCDFLKFKNKIGFDDAKEVLKTYLNRNDRNIDKLVKYSKKLRVHTIIDQYLKILI
jgi:predicted transcriptional regulator of viral defense system